MNRRSPRWWAKLSYRLWLLQIAALNLARQPFHLNPVTKLATRFPRAAHWCSRRLYYVIGTEVVINLIPIHALPTLWNRVVFGLYALVLFAVLLLQMGHEHTLCERCLDDEFDITGGPARAERKMQVLRFYHRRLNFWSMVTFGFLAAVLVLMIWHAQAAAFLLTVPMAVYVFLGLWCIRPHSQLQMWCRWCRDDGGDIHEHSPEVPDYVGRR